MKCNEKIMVSALCFVIEVIIRLLFEEKLVYINNTILHYMHTSCSVFTICELFVCVLYTLQFFNNMKRKSMHIIIQRRSLCNLITLIFYKKTFFQFL